jgi:hypothetical protein
MGPPLFEPTLVESALATTTLLALSAPVGPATQQPGALLFQSALAIIAQRP